MGQERQEQATRPETPWRELERRRVAAFRLASLAPPATRAGLAERFLRRPGAPGPAAEHVLQYLVSADRAGSRAATPERLEAVKAAGAGSDRARRASEVLPADTFYRNQYRQYLGAVMGAFAMTAPQLFATSAVPAEPGLAGRLARPRRVVAAMLGSDDTRATPAALVLSHEAVAVPVYLPRAASPGAESATARWLAGAGAVPGHLRPLIDGTTMPAGTSGARTRRRSELGAVCELVDAAVRSHHLALLALHPYDPDAMGLHVTLFGVEALDADAVEADYALGAGALDAYRDAARRRGEAVTFLVGGTAEIFTQCSQNLFVKRPDPCPSEPVGMDGALPSLEELLAEQFELLQATADATGVPGASPRNGQIGRAAFVGRRRSRSYVLIPYHPGNAIHGHAAKLWSNRHSCLMVSDDHATRRRVTIAGPSWITSHARVAARFPDVAREALRPEGERARTVAEPVYWFVTRVDEVVWSTEPLGANVLHAERAACTIHAGGEGRHAKKAAYFDAGAVDRYDQHGQHARERAGRPTDRSGAAGRAWQSLVADALAARRAHLATVEPLSGT
jgi:hypothetical protein